MTRLALAALLCATLATPVLAQRHADLVYLQQAKAAKAARANRLANGGARQVGAKQEQAQQAPAKPAAAQAASGNGQ